MILPAGDTNGVRGLCLDPHDLAIAKYVARREKDVVFTRELVARGLLRKDQLFLLLGQVTMDDDTRVRVRGFIEKDFSTHGRAQERP